VSNLDVEGADAGCGDGHGHSASPFSLIQRFLDEKGAFKADATGKFGSASTVQGNWL
jgi:hypothetical protein